MLSLRHSIGNVAPLESLARNSTSVPHFRCYASPPRTEIYARCDQWMPAHRLVGGACGDAYAGTSVGRLMHRDKASSMRDNWASTDNQLRRRGSTQKGSSDRHLYLHAGATTIADNTASRTPPGYPRVRPSAAPASGHPLGRRRRTGAACRI